MAPTAPPQLWIAIKAIHYAYPGLVFGYFILALMITVCTLQTQRLRVQDQHVRREVILGIIFGVTLSYLSEVIVLVVQVVLTKTCAEEDRIVYLIASTICFGAQALALTDSKFPVWYPYYVTWFMGLLVELALLVVMNVFEPPKSTFDFTMIVLQFIRISFFVTLPSLYFCLRNDGKAYDNADAERQCLLRNKLAGKQSSEDSGKGYGGTTDTNKQGSDTAETSDAGSEDSWLAGQREAQDKIQKRLQQDGNWFTYAKGFAIFFPYLWPVHDRVLQFRAVLVGFCLLASNAFNVLVPTQMGVMIDSLSKYVLAGENDPKPNIWLPVAIYTVLRFVSGSACIGWLRKWLWLPVEQYSYNALSTASHAHLMSLSSDFHDSKTSSDLTQAVHGGRSVTELLETVCFQVLPMFIDLAVAFAFLWTLYGPYMGLMMAATAATFLYVTTKLYSRRASKRREYIVVYRKEWTTGQQSLDGWSTASLFNMIPYERHRYASAVKEHMKSKKDYEMSSQAIGAAQGLILSLGLLGALWLGVWQVAFQGESVGKFTTLLVYWAQLQNPLSFFATMYRQISYSLMDAERLLELFQTKPTITDLPNAKPLKLGRGLVKFDRVSFAYDERKPTLKDVSFEVPAGKTVALVGETGGGKSTILKLIDRFYDVKSGSISIDGQDVRDVTIESLRGKIGVVPQDPMLFNDSIMNNIRYARTDASDKDVYEACIAAAVHDKILSFPDGYDSKVGDRGVKLSGGEKQRVAIARAILKQPEIILLDEATSAVDTETEQLIQEGFKTLCKGRTTFIVAHRLSTIMKADHILVVMNGEIIEKGSHDELLHAGGKYHNLWSKQIFVKPVPATERSRSSSPKKRDADIVNDLTPHRHTKELAKVLKTTPYDDEAVQETSKQDDGKIENNSHKPEGSKLKPDAPEFVPGRSNTTETDSLHKLNPKDAAKAQKKQEKEERKVGNLAKKAGKKFAKLGIDLNSSTADEQYAGPSNDQLTEGDLSTNDKQKSKRSRKRHMSRSDSAIHGPDQTDGQQDSDVTAVSSGEGFPGPAVQRRRVSAPIDQPANPDARGPRRRNRHWRLRNRAADFGGSGNMSPRASGEASTDEVHVPPAAGIPEKVNPTPRVTFAPSHVDGAGSGS